MTDEKDFTPLPPITRLKFKAGEQVAKEGDYGIAVYKIRRGTLEVFSNQGGEEIVFERLPAGRTVGEENFVYQGLIPNPASLRAVVPTELEVWHVARLRREFDALPPFLRFFLEQPLNRLVRTRNLLAEQEARGRRPAGTRANGTPKVSEVLPSELSGPAGADSRVIDLTSTVVFPVWTAGMPIPEGPKTKAPPASGTGKAAAGASPASTATPAPTPTPTSPPPTVSPPPTTLSAEEPATEEERERWAAQKRRFYRKDVEMDIEYRPVGGPNIVLRGRLMDISRGGLGLEITSANLRQLEHKAGDRFEFDFVLPEYGEIRLAAQVVHRKEGRKKGLFFLGMSFISIGYESQKRLGFFLMP